MATFEAQVQGLTGLTIDGSSTPTEEELTEFLKDGVIDVTAKYLDIAPQDSALFIRKSSLTDSQGLDIGRASIISVMREANLDGSSDGTTSWRNCKRVSVSLQSRVVDPESLHFASKYSPVYILDDSGKINVYPVPSANNGYQVYYINNEPKGDGTSDSLARGHTTIGYFPTDKVYLVVIYAAIKSLEAKMSEFAIDEEDEELVRGITSNIAALRSQYDAVLAKPQPQPAQRGRR